MTIRKPKESDLYRPMLELLAIRGIFAWRNNSGGAKIGGSFVRFGTPGASDLIGCLPGGQFIGVEVKIGRNRPTASQEAFAAAVRERGGLAITVHSLTELDALLTEALEARSR